MKKLMIVIFMVICTAFTGCGDGVSQEEYDEVIAERDSLKKELSEKESEQEEQSEPNIIFNEKYIVDGEEISIILGETNNEIILTMYGHAKDREKAYLMFATFLAECKNIDKLLGRYSVVVNFGELNITYMTTDSGYMVMGTNEDGTTTLEMPDWIPQELSGLTMEENEIEKYLFEIDSKILEFGVNSGYRMGILLDEIKENFANDSQAGRKENEENSNSIIYSDKNVIITFVGISGEEDDYTINLVIENLSDKTLQISDENISINGYMADPLFVTTVAPGKKTKDGMKMYYNRAEEFPMSEITNIEGKFRISNDDDWTDVYYTESIIIYNAE